MSRSMSKCPDCEAKDARISELEDYAVLATLAKNNDQLRARIAELEKRFATQLVRTVDANTRAERAEEQAHYANGVADLAMKHRNSAEAELKAMRELLDWIYGFLAYADSYHSRMIRAKARAALAPPPAKTFRVPALTPDQKAHLNTLEPQPYDPDTMIGAPSPAGPDGKSLAVLYCMERAEEDVKLLREALEGMIAVAEGRFDGNPHADIDALAKARAALNPSPAGEKS